MSKLTVGSIGGIPASLNQASIPAGHTLQINGNVYHDGTGAMRLPTGTTGQRPSSPTTGYIRWNTSLGAVEVYNGSTWIQYYGENGTSNAPFTSLANLSSADPGSGYWYIKFDGTNIEEIYAYKDTNGSYWVMVASITDNTSNWDTAYGWGNHASQGYLTQLPVHGLGVHTGVTLTNETAGDLLRYSGTQWENWAPDYATQTWVQSQNYFVGIPSEVVQGNSKVEVIGSGTDDGEFKVTLQDNTSGGAGATALRVHTDSSVNVIEFNEGNPGAKSRLVLNHLTTTNAWSEIHFKRTGASPGTSIIRSGGGGSGGYIQFYPVDGNNDFQVSGTGTYTRLNAIIGGSLTAGGLTYPTTNGTNGQVLTSDGAGNVAWAAGGGGGGASVTISDTPPAASAGDLWWESDSGRLKIYYQDVDSAQWVDVAPPLAPALSSNAPATASSTGSAGDIRYDSGYVYVCVATDTWKRAALTTW